MAHFLPMHSRWYVLLTSLTKKQKNKQTNKNKKKQQNKKKKKTYNNNKTKITWCVKNNNNNNYGNIFQCQCLVMVSWYEFSGKILSEVVSCIKIIKSLY